MSKDPRPNKTVRLNIATPISSFGQTNRHIDHRAFVRDTQQFGGALSASKSMVAIVVKVDRDPTIANAVYANEDCHYQEPLALRCTCCTAT
jgi:hypothetical protein